MDEVPTLPAPRESCLARREVGLTMIELMVVVLIIGILLAIAIPSYVAQRRAADDRAAETVLRTSAIAARSRVTDGIGYDAVTPGALGNEEPALTFVGAAVAAEASQHAVSVRNGGTEPSTWIMFVTRSRSGRCFAVLHRADAPARYQTTQAPSCAGDDFDPAPGAWQDHW